MHVMLPESSPSTRGPGIATPASSLPSDIAPHLRPLSSAGITRRLRSYGPLRHPDGPACPSRDSGWCVHTTDRASRVASIPLLHACRRHYPGGTGQCARRSLPSRWQPSPFYRRVGFRITRFEACSAFTKVAARMLAEPPMAVLLIGVLQTRSLPPSPAPTATGWSDSCRAGFAPAEGRRLRTAHGKVGLVLSWYNGFSNPNGAIAQLEELKSKLSFESTVETLEQALDDLSRLFGAVGVRPEKQYRRGPDNLWVWPELAWVIEVKHQRGTLPKVDGNQMLASMRWFEEMYPEHNAVAIVVARTVMAERDAFFPKKTRVLTPDSLKSLVDNLGRFLGELVTQKPLFWRPQTVNQLLYKFDLSPSQFGGSYTKILKK